MTCAECRGACCEEFSIPNHAIDREDPVSLWLSYHAERRFIPVMGKLSPVYLFNCRCTKLSPEGTCTIYEDRPEPCRQFLQGGPDCLAAIERRRPGGDSWRLS